MFKSLTILVDFFELSNVVRFVVRIGTFLETNHILHYRNGTIPFTINFKIAFAYDNNFYRNL